MRKLLIMAALLILNLARAELVNVNPNPFGEPWFVGGWRELTVEDKAKIAALPKLILPESYKGKLLPASKNNSLEQYFRPIFNQEGGSCGQASGVAYNFTYEMAIARQTAASTNVNQYPSHYTWNFLNGGVGQGSTYFDGWEIIKANGCPTVASYGGIWPNDYENSSTIWMTGYDKYYNAMKNKVTEIATIEVGTPDGLQTLKQWMNDHLSGMSVGGLANFSAGASSADGFTQEYLPAGTPSAGKMVITRWGSAVNHAMTFVGYDDSIRVDRNNDNRYTNNLDINSDGVVDMLDWEKGGLIMVNSWGNSFGDNGRAFVPYHLLAETVEDGGIQGNSVYVVKVRPDYQPKLTIKAKIKHNSRNKLKIYAGASADPQATTPSYNLPYPLFNSQGGDLTMQGISGTQYQTIEIGLDITPLLSELSSGQNGKIFLQVQEQDPNGIGSGSIISYSVINYTGAQPVETTCPQTNITINNNNKTMLAVVTGATYDEVSIITSGGLPYAVMGLPYSHQLSAAGGQAPYKWNIVHPITQADFTESYPAITDNPIAFANDDDSYKAVELGFQFPFFGKKYDKITVLTDGVISFQEKFDYIRMEGALAQNRAIAVFGSDLLLNSAENDAVYVKKEADKITIRWKVSQFDHPEINIDVAAVLTADGKIKMYYNNNLSTGLDWVAGISDGDGVNFSLSEYSNLYNPSGKRRDFVQPEFPYGLSISSNGLFSGIAPNVFHTFNLKFMVTDFNRISKTKNIYLAVGDVGISEENKEPIASLLSNYPNPFNNSSLIKFNLKTESVVRLTVYNAKGEMVKELLNCNRSAGINSVTFDANGLNSGVYFYKLQTGNNNLVSKMILTK